MGTPAALEVAAVTTNLLFLGLQCAGGSGFPMQFVLSAYPEKCLGMDQYSELGSVVLGGQRELTPGIGRRLETMTCWLLQKVYSQGRPGQVRILGQRHCQEQWTREQRRLGWGAERAERTPQLALLAPPSGAGRKAAGSACVPSRASARAGLAVRAVEEPRKAGWEAVQGQGHLAAESSLGLGAGSAALPSAVRTAVWMDGAWRGGQRGAACQGAAVAACASWLHSAPEAQWRGRTAADFASVLPAEQPGGQEAFLLLEVLPVSSYRGPSPLLLHFQPRRPGFL